MALVTMGVKLDDEVRERLKTAAEKVDRTPHWLIKQAIYTQLDALDRGLSVGQGFDPAMPSAAVAMAVADEAEHLAPPQPFLEFAEQVMPHYNVMGGPRRRWRPA